MLIISVLCLIESAGGLIHVTPKLGLHRLRRLNAVVSERGHGSLSQVEEAIARGSATAYDEAIKKLENAVDAVRALDLENEYLGTSSFASALEVIAERAPASTCGALVGHVITRLKKRPDAAVACMSDDILSPLACSLVKARKDQQALTAVDAMSGPKSARDYRSGIVAASRLNDAKKVRQLLLSALRKEQQAAAQKMKNQTNEEEIDTILSTLDERTLKFALKVLGKAGDFRTPFSVLDALPLERRSVPLYHAAIAACGRTKPPKGRTAMLLWKKMKTDGLGNSIPRATYNALLHCAQASPQQQNDQSRADRAGTNATTAILHEMAQRGIGLNVVSYNIALNSLAEQARFGEVLELLERMESSKIQPTAVTFGTAIHGAARANNSAAAVELLRANIKYCANDLPGDASFGAALEACTRDPDAAQAAAAAQNVVQIMCDTNVDLERRERIEELARVAIHRGILDPERTERAETILGMALHNRQAVV